MDLKIAQAEARYSYLRGGTGAFISGLIWLVAGLVSDSLGISTGFIVLFFGGMLIFPLSIVLDRWIFKRPAVASGHPSGQIVIETIFPMMGMLFIAWLMIPLKPDWVFAIAAIGVGTHYFGFRSAYGDFNYWIIGGLLTLVGFASIYIKQPNAQYVPYIIAGIEIVYGVWLTALSIKNDKAP